MKAFRSLIIKGKCSHQLKTSQMIGTDLNTRVKLPLNGLAESFEVQENLFWALFMDKVHLPQGCIATARRHLSTLTTKSLISLTHSR